MWNMSPPPGSWREYQAEGGALAKGAGVEEGDNVICYWHGGADIRNCGTPRQGHPGGGVREFWMLRRCSCLVFWQENCQWGTSGLRLAEESE